MRIQFIKPMFKALGWDMENEQRYAEAYKEVVHEASLKIGDESNRCRRAELHTGGVDVAD